MLLKNDDCEPSEIDELFQKRPTVIKPGLERIKAALDLMGQPGLKTPRIVIAGTNGKGSTSGYIWRLLSACGIRAGLFSSPHLIHFRERITVTDREVSNQVIIQNIRRLKERLPESLWNDLSFFEVNTILALMVFEQFETKVNVLEVGLGGRLDCCNVYDPDVSVITSIGFDHQEFLGDTLAKIAREKAGIMRQGVPIIWGGSQSSEKEAHDTIIQVASDAGAIVTSEDCEPAFDLPISLMRRPVFLQRNFRLAFFALCELVKSKKVKGLSLEQLAMALREFDRKDLPWPVTLCGRFDLIKVSKNDEARFLLVDVCHNPHGAKALSHALDEFGLTKYERRLPCLISVLADKDATGIWLEIKGKIKDVIKFKIASSRTWSDDDDRIEGVMMASFAEAWAEAIRRSDWTTNEPWLVFGSVAAVGEVFAFLNRTGWSIERGVSLP